MPWCDKLKATSTIYLSPSLRSLLHRGSFREKEKERKANRRRRLGGEMKPLTPLQSVGRINPQKLGCAAITGCLLVPLFFLAVLRQNSPSLSNLNLQIWIVRGDESTLLMEEMSHSHKSGAAAAAKVVEEPGMVKMVEEPAEVVVAETLIEAAAPHASSFPSETSSSIVSTHIGNTSSSNSSFNATNNYSDNNNKDGISHNGGNNSGGIPQDSKIECDFSGSRTEVCELSGNVRIHGKSSSIVLVEHSMSISSMANNSWKMRPYARKWEASTMSYIRELSLKSSSTPKETAQCNRNHSVAAVVFSTGGFQGNFFHDLTDVLIPLYLTAHQFTGEVQFLITDFKSPWVDKYQPILKHLSHYQAINLDSNDRVHCFPHAIIGLRSHKELGIDPLQAPKGSSMTQFRRFLRKCYSLKREFTKMTGDNHRLSRKKPRLLLMSRKKSRAFLNEGRIIRMGTSLGYKVVVARPEATRNLSEFAQVVNGCDVMMGVHGAGLTNMVFLPTNATVIQVVPWGGLKYACRFAFGEPAMGMGLRYLEYEIGKEESSLIKQYPRNHTVFTDPLSIHKQGFGAIWSVFLEKQNVMLDVRRFKGVLLEALQTLN